MGNIHNCIYEGKIQKIILYLSAILFLPALHAPTRAYISKETGSVCQYPADWKHCTANEYPEMRDKGLLVFVKSLTYKLILYSNEKNNEFAQV